MKDRWEVCRRDSVYGVARCIRSSGERVATDGVMDEEVKRTSNGSLCKAKKAGLEPAKTPSRGPRREGGGEVKGAIAAGASKRPARRAKRAVEMWPERRRSGGVGVIRLKA